MGCWKIVDEFDLEEDENYIWYDKLNHNTPLELEAIVMLDPEQIVVGNMKHAEEGNIKVRVHFKMICELLNADSLKLIQHTEMMVPLQE